MPKIVVWENGEKVVRDALPEELPQPFTSAELDAIADQIAEEEMETNKKVKALGMVLADLAVASGVAPDVPTARQVVKTRFRDYYRQLIS